MMTPGRYLRSALGDFLLTLAVAVSLCYVLLNGFYAAPELQYSPLPALMVGACLVALFALAYNKRTARIGGVAYAVALVVCWAAAASLTPDNGYLQDNEANYLIFAMCCTLCATGCFLLTRRRLSASLLFIGGCFAIALVQFLYERNEVAWTVAFVLASLALLVNRNYLTSVHGASTVRKASFAAGTLVALGIAAASVGVGLAVWFGVIAPLNPGALEVKLITEHQALETVEVRGTANVVQVPNLNMTSDQLIDDERTTDDIKESAKGRPTPATGAPQEVDPAGEAGAFSGIDLDVADDLFDMRGPELSVPVLVVIALALIALLVAYFVGRRVLRAKRLERWEALGTAERVQAAYLFLVGRLGRMGIAVAPGQTQGEFARANANTLLLFEEASGVPFAALAQCYEASVYGRQEPSGEQWECFKSFYGSFWRACRQKLGTGKYLIKSVII